MLPTPRARAWGAKAGQRCSVVRSAMRKTRSPSELRAA